MGEITLKSLTNSSEKCSPKDGRLAVPSQVRFENDGASERGIEPLLVYLRYHIFVDFLDLLIVLTMPLTRLWAPGCACVSHCLASDESLERSARIK